MKQFLRAQLQIQSLSTASSCGITGHGDVIPPLSDLTFGIFMSLPKTEQLLYFLLSTTINVMLVQKHTWMFVNMKITGLYEHLREII